MPGTRFSLELQPNIPARLERLNDLACDLLYSWERQVRSLFWRLDAGLWERCGHNPKVFLRQVPQQALDEAAEDRVFTQEFNRVISAYDTYMEESHHPDLLDALTPGEDLVAYFCAEFGFHESFPIYSGGLGILAGDHCKAASDMGVPFVAVGILYRQGYFTQTIDGGGNQVAHYRPTDFTDLPIEPALDTEGNELHVHIDLPLRRVELKVWVARAGHIRLYLLDSDVPANSENDRAITFQLYGGDIRTRIQQEIVLGIGGVRALRALGLEPTVWHINEGHAAFLLLERVRELVGSGLDFETALEAVAAATVFTTHTPVPAGHDIFSHELMREYFADYIPQLGIDESRFLALGATDEGSHGFNQTTLALRGSRFHNGVSRIHGGVASHMEAAIWPQIPPAENPIGYVTNGIHVPTFLAREWANLLDMHFGGGWRNELLNPEYWERIEEIPDHSFWSLRQSLKALLLEDVRRRALRQHRRNGCSEAQIERLTRYLEPTETDLLIVGFARRFATYKRATLLFRDPERLARLVGNTERPVLFIFAGKAHPQDQPGQELIKTINSIARRPEFEGRILLLENFDLSLARKLLMGVDVWLNNPAYPMEASGTSGQKAAINGVINLSVTDGWWGEAYDRENGWAITPHGPQYSAEFRDREEAEELLQLLERQIVPLYYKRNGHGYSEGWVAKSKASMKSILPRFNAQRMLRDYIRDYYGPAAAEGKSLATDNHQPAHELARWKRRVTDAWPRVAMRRSDHRLRAIHHGEGLPVEVTVELAGLAPQDVVVECLLGTEDESGSFCVHNTQRLPYVEENGHGEAVFRAELHTAIAGMQYYKLRMYPYHQRLSHPFETGRMLWV